ncbi:glycosyltransferase [Belliella marina]|uniref:Glycosyltransferase n=1 Tax=Belliella marina TaxID=1644146 RepID=A0ABW4VNM9_9BACT
MKKIDKKILFILHLPPPIHGAALMGKFLKESELINSSFNCSYVNLGVSENLNEIGQGNLKKIPRFLEIIKNVLIAIYRNKPDLVYMTPTSKGFGFYKDALLAIVIRLLKIDLVYHFHNKGFCENQNRFFYNLIYKLIFKNCKAVLLSKMLYDDIKKYIPEKDLYICPNGIPPTNPIREPTTNNNTVEILFLSNLLIAKGILILLDACKILKANNLDFKCIIIGAEADISALELKNKINELNLSNCVNYLGKKYGEEKFEIMAQADIFVLPTFDEAFPLVNLEAMQFSLPIVTTNVGGIPDMVINEHNGFIVEKENPVELASKIEFLIHNNDSRVKMGINGRKKYETEFTLEIFEKRMKEILIEVVHKNN